MPASLWSETARATAKAESAHNLQTLQKEGLLNIHRSVKIEASPYNADVPLAPGTKLVHLIRHGQGFHNMLADLWREFGREVDPHAKGQGAAAVNPYNRPEVLDPPLTALGRDQAKALQPHTKTLKPQLIVVSAVRRATETALLGFAHLLESGGDAGKPEVPFVGHPDCVERRHANICDKRRPMSEIKREFPMIDWSHMSDEQDLLWSDTVDEAWRAVGDRGHSFLLWLRDRPESEIAVATHSAWLFALLNTAVKCTEPGLAEWFMTGELRSVVLTFTDDDPNRTKRARTSADCPPTFMQKMDGDPRNAC